MIAIVCLIALLASYAPPSLGYAVLAHEAIIDSLWASDIRPLLLRRFPGATGDELRRAHAFAYGGAIIQDLGYYPHGSHLFSDLVHYVRSAEFVEALLRNSQDLDEYAFALGALSHYSADNDGHKIGVNRSVPMLYPKLEKKYGDVMTYAENPAAHLKTEFGFDVLEVARQHYAPDAYHDFIGFEVAKPVMERAFRETYCIDLKTVFGDFDRAVNSYRYDVSTLIPKATRIAWAIKKSDIQNEAPSMTHKKFLYHMSRASFNKNWGTKYEQPGFGTKLLAFIIRIIPKFGPLKALDFRTPTPQAENMFMASFNAAVDSYHQEMKSIPGGGPKIPNTNFDTGEISRPGEYTLADDAYAALVDRLKESKFQNLSPELRQNILRYYADMNMPFDTKKKHKNWARLVEELGELKAVDTSATPTRAAGLVP